MAPSTQPGSYPRIVAALGSLLALVCCAPAADTPRPPPAEGPPPVEATWPPDETKLIEQAVASVSELFAVDAEAATAQALTAGQIREWVATYRTETNADSLGVLVDSAVLPVLDSIDQAVPVGVRVPNVYAQPCARTPDVVYVPALPRQAPIPTAAPAADASEPAASSSRLPHPTLGGVLLADFCHEGAVEPWCRNCTGCEGPCQPPAPCNYCTCVCTQSKRCSDCRACNEPGC